MVHLHSPNRFAVHKICTFHSGSCFFIISCCLILTSLSFDRPIFKTKLFSFDPVQNNSSSEKTMHMTTSTRGVLTESHCKSSKINRMIRKFIFLSLCKGEIGLSKEKEEVYNIISYCNDPTRDYG